MVQSIPPPNLTTLLPPFLSHIPASFTSPKPPPSLPPLLTPLLRSRLTHLAFNITPSESSFLSLLTWSSTPSDGQNLHDHLSTQDYYFLHQPPSPGTFVLKGYRRLDTETLQCLVEVPELEIIVVYLFVENDIISEESTETKDGWKVNEVRLADEEDVLTGSIKWSESVDAAETAFRERTSKKVSSGYSTATASYPYEQQKVNEEEDDDDDDYWGRYDDEDTESSAGDQQEQRPMTATTTASTTASAQQSPVQAAAEILARRVLHPESESISLPPPQSQPQLSLETSTVATTTTAEEDAYFARYASVEPVLDRNPTSTPPHQTHQQTQKSDPRRDSTSTTNTNPYTLADSTLSTPLTLYTQPSMSKNISPTVTQAGIGRVIGGLENAAEVHSQSEVAIKQHISTSVKSLYRLWKAGGMEAGDFGRFLEREVECILSVEGVGGLEDG